MSNPKSQIPNPDKRILADHEAREAIASALDETLVVEAAAGTGKTTELVRRIIRIIETGRAEVSGIVAVTFTEKAAGELKLRLREALEEARRKAAANADAKTPVGRDFSRASTGADELSRLDDALGRLEEAQISTIHGFCADLLRERPVEARTDPLFAVLTEGQGQRLYDEAFRRWMEDQLADPPEGVRRSLRRPSFSGFGFQADVDDGPIGRISRAGWELIQWRDFEGEWTREPFTRQSRIDTLVAQLTDFVQLLASPANPYDNLYYDSRSARQRCDDLQRTESVVGRDYDRLEAALIELGRNRDFKNARKGTGRMYRQGVLREDVWQARERLMSALASFERDANADLAVLLRQELRACVAEFEAAKSRAGALDFLDLLLKARNLIRDDEGVRRSFQSRFQRIFVDEFQDTDPLQAEILMLLAADDPSVNDWRKVNPVPGKLFIVGDPKQSIYRFRRADVGVYRTVYEMLKAAGAKQVTLQTSFRSQPNIQRVINAAFEPVMTGDSDALQADYVPLRPFRPDAANQPSVVVLPVPKPYGVRRISNVEIEKSLPDAVGAYIHWLINESGWKVAERPAGGLQLTTSRASAAVGFQPAERERLVPIQARHICLLFRRFVSYDEDVTRTYVQALEARGIPHLLVGGRSFHNRAEIETLRAALAAIEWPDDELSVFATLRGSLFAIGDEDLLEYRYRFGGLHPFSKLVAQYVVSGFSRTVDGESSGANDLERFTHVLSALAFLQSLHKSRNHVTVASTITQLLEATRAHVGFALEHGGEQVLANVSHVAELARRYEAEGGISFRGFLEELRAQAESGEATEAPILEEGSDGVRLMTVHKAKGLEFPVVVLVDMTAKLHRATASRYLDADRRVCAVQLAGCSPRDLIDHEQDELRRDAAEGARLAYVAATRARDLLVVPAVGDAEREGWIQSLNSAIYPPMEIRRQQAQAAGCVEFKTKDSVLSRPDGDPANASTVCPGRHEFAPRQMLGASRAEPRDADYALVWWDPHVLDLGVELSLGIRKPDLIVKDVPNAIVDFGLKNYKNWKQQRDDAGTNGGVPSIKSQTAAQFAAVPGDTTKLPDVEIVELPKAAERPSGRRFGTLIHAVLSSVPLDARDDIIHQLTRTHSRVLACSDEETASAAHVVRTVLAHPLLHQAFEASKANRCRREVPVSWKDESGALIEGVIDLVFEDGKRSTIVDFKSDEELRLGAEKYKRQIGIYAAAVGACTGKPVSSVLMRV
jgi:ATP-dependent exoDNAse (exonuclease V) beta subunit